MAWAILVVILAGLTYCMPRLFIPLLCGAGIVAAGVFLAKTGGRSFATYAVPVGAGAAIFVALKGPVVAAVIVAVKGIASAMILLASMWLKVAVGCLALLVAILALQAKGIAVTPPALLVFGVVLYLGNRYAVSVARTIGMFRRPQLPRYQSPIIQASPTMAHTPSSAGAIGSLLILIIVLLLAYIVYYNAFAITDQPSTPVEVEASSNQRTPTSSPNVSDFQPR